MLGKLLHCWSQLGLEEGEIVDAADAQDAHPRECAGNTVHERATGIAEVVGHPMVLAGRLDEYRLVLSPRLEVLTTSYVLEMGV